VCWSAHFVGLRPDYEGDLGGRDPAYEGESDGKSHPNRADLQEAAVAKTAPKCLHSQQR